MKDLSDRYDKTHFYGEIDFYLSSYYPNHEECRILILKVLDQAIRDYCSLTNSTIQSEIATWETAYEFLFDDEYRILWGEKEYSTEEFLGLVDLELEWVREQAQVKFKEKNNGPQKNRR